MGILADLLNMMGKGISHSDLSDLRELPEDKFRAEIWSLLAENYGGRDPFYKRSQSEAAFEMLMVLARRSSVGIGSSDVKAIIRMAKDCW